jgi:hypothetical protein
MNILEDNLHIPANSTVHVDEEGFIEFMTPEGQSGIITDSGATLFDGDIPQIELTFAELFDGVELADRAKRASVAQNVGYLAHWSGTPKNPLRTQGHVSKVRK